MQWFKKLPSLNQVPGVSCSCCRLTAARGHLQLEGNASLLEKDSPQISTELCPYFHRCFSLPKVQLVLPLLSAPSPLFLGTQYQLLLWWEAKKVFPFCLNFLAKFLSSPIKFLVCYARNKDTFILMQCDVSFAQKVERSKCPRDSRSFRCWSYSLPWQFCVMVFYFPEEMSKLFASKGIPDPAYPKVE